MPDPNPLSLRQNQQKIKRLSYPISIDVESEDEQDEASDARTISSATTVTTATTVSTQSTAVNGETFRDRSSKMMRPKMIESSESSTADDESQTAYNDLEYQLLWEKVMGGKTGRRFNTYTNAWVLLLCWANSCDDLVTKEEVNRLSSTFEDQLNFDTQIKYLDTAHKTRLQVQVNTIVANFIGAHDGPQTLLVVYYAGHGRLGNPFGALELFGPNSPNDENARTDSLVWNKTNALLEDAEADVLEIFDCCYSGTLGLAKERQGKQRTVEYLAATEAMGVTCVPGENSFTTALIWALDALVKETSAGRFTTVELVEKIAHAPDFPSGQLPNLSTRNLDSSPGRIMLSPLQKADSDTPQSPSVLQEASRLADLVKERVLTLHFHFGHKPTVRDVELLARNLNSIFERDVLGLNMVRWGGLRQTALALVTSTFEAMLKRRRQISNERDSNPQLTLPMSPLEYFTHILKSRAHSRSVSPLSSKSFPVTGSGSATSPQTSHHGSATSLRLLSSATSTSVADQWEESNHSKHEQRNEKPLTVRDILVKAISNNNTFTENSEPSFINVAYRCSWEVLYVLQNEYEPNGSLSGIITLTGTLETAQAATCEEYITQTWPNAGPFLLQAISDTLKGAQGTQLKYDLPPCGPAQRSITGFKHIELSVEKAPLIVGKAIRPIVLRVQGSISFQAEVAEILAWLTAAIRISESTELKLSRARVLFTQYSEDTKQFEFCIEPETLETSHYKADFCWQPLFVNSVIAVQFPARQRFQGIGVDISPMLMATLAGTVTAVEFCGGLILKGLSTALIPVKRLRGEQAIQWHLEVTNSTDGIIQTRNLEESDIENVEFELYRVDNVETFWENQAYLGWCSLICILLGTKKIDYSRVTWSDPIRHQKTLNLNSFSIGLAPTGGGIGGPSVGGNFTIGKRNKPVFMRIEQELEDRLKLSIVKPQLSYDTRSKRAWMTPETCMLLHMMHIRARMLENCIRPARQENVAEMPFANITQDGGLEAYYILVKYLRTKEVSPLGSSETWKKTLANFYVGLDMALNESIIAKEKVSLASSSELCGFELLDIVRAESPFKFTSRKIQRESGGWTTAAKDLGYALYCSELGDAIIPREGANSLCPNWQRVPHNSDYLCAYVPCIAEILAHQGKHTSHQRLVANEFRQLHYKHCRHEERSRCFHLQTFDEVSDPPRLESRSDPNGAANSHAAYGIGTSSEGNCGALIFGKTTKMTKAYPRNGLPDDGEERRHRIGGFLSLDNSTA